MKHEKTRRLAVTAMLCALAYAAVAVARIPITPVEFLKYEPKDVIIAIGGFLYGPLAALSISVIVSLIEMLTISSTGWIGFAMNVLSSVAFSGIAALVYRKKRTLGGAVLGLCLGVVCMAGTMVLWNYLITPLYMGTSRADVAAMLLPIILPFNLLKGCLNGALTALLCRVCAMRISSRKAAPHPQGSAASCWSGSAPACCCLPASSLFYFYAEFSEKSMAGYPPAMLLYPHKSTATKL